MLWNEKTEARLMEIVNRDDGTPLKDVAAMLAAEFACECTKNTVIGKIQRLKARNPDCMTREIKPRGKYVRREKQTEAAVIEPVSVPYTLPVGIRLEDRHDTQCPFPRWGDDGNPDFLVCGDEKDPQHPYCEAHMRVTHTAGSKVRVRETGHRGGFREFARGVGAAIDLRESDV